ncbi:DinB family protein [Rufibacter tibetensis]|uniref:Metal-dependent hydrolase n=1 Tax=Rufibacter tibetensis TaxID=512763 RepID=A0A0P0CYC2_9BACT|nr:DinB family protein [Rufibacter tibetensis]ALJ00430.1 metal-dependent hydrolase [Rufibacter tibetensis]
MEKEEKLEVWLRGPLPGVPPLLQPVAHALLQAREEVEHYLITFPEDLLWEKPAGLASVGFHLQHLTGVLDRLFTYARGEQLSPEALSYLKSEGAPPAGGTTVHTLVKSFAFQVDKALEQIKFTDEQTLLETRGVGRSQIPSTVLGLLFHAAEHTQRHVGQLLVTSKVLLAGKVHQNVTNPIH